MSVSTADNSSSESSHVAIRDNGQSGASLVAVADRLAGRHHCGLVRTEDACCGDRWPASLWGDDGLDAPVGRQTDSQ